MSDNYYYLELMARDEARRVAADLRRRQMLARACALRPSILRRLIRAARRQVWDAARLVALWSVWRPRGRGCRADGSD